MQGVVATLGRQRLFMDRDRFTSILLHWVYSRVRPPDFRRPSFEKRPVPNGRQNCLQTCAVRIAGSLCLLVHCQRNAAGHLLRLVGRTHLMLESLCVCVCVVIISVGITSAFCVCLGPFFLIVTWMSKHRTNPSFFTLYSHGRRLYDIKSRGNVSLVDGGTFCACIVWSENVRTSARAQRFLFPPRKFTPC